MKKNAFLLCLFLLTILLTSCKAREESLMLAKGMPKAGENVILTAKYHAGNEWYSSNSNEDSVNVQIYTSGFADTVELGGVRQSGAVIDLKPLSEGSAKISMLYSDSADSYCAGATLYEFDVRVDEEQEITCTPIIPTPSIVLGLEDNDGSYWELDSCGEKAVVMDAAYIEDDGENAVNPAACYFPVIPVSEGVSTANFVLKNADGAAQKTVTYYITVDPDKSVSLKISKSE